MDGQRIARLGLVVHPRREIGGALELLQSWSDDRGIDLVQVPATGDGRQVAKAGDPALCDVVIALGGDGTTLAALRTAAAVGRPVMGVACGSLGALTAVTADDLGAALLALERGDWTARRLPGLTVSPAGLSSVNDLVIVRAGAGQIAAEVSVDGELFIRFAGDGLVVATALGSSAYTLAAGGPVLAPGASGMVFTPLSPHGGSCPPLVAGEASTIAIELDPGHGGARLELDGQIQGQLEREVPQTLEVELRRDHATLVSLGGEDSMLTGLRRRRVIIDSPRMLARDERQQAARAGRD